LHALSILFAKMRNPKVRTLREGSSNQAPMAHFCGWKVESESKADVEPPRPLRLLNLRLRLVNDKRKVLVVI